MKNMKLVLQETPSVIYGYLNEEEMLFIQVTYPFYWLVQPGIRTRPSLGDILNGVIEYYNKTMELKQRYELGLPIDEDEDENDPPTLWILG